MHSFLLGDRFVLPGGRKVGLRYLVGFKLQLAFEFASSAAGRRRRPEAIVRASRHAGHGTNLVCPSGCSRNAECF